MIVPAMIIVFVGAGLMCLARAAWGPTAPDRIVSIDALTSMIIVALVLFGIQYKQPVFLDVALVYAFLAFIGTLAVSKYLEGKGVGS